MKERPILFNGEMVRALLDGRKTQTRRLVSEKLLEKYYDYDDWCQCVMPRGEHDFTVSRTYEKQFFEERCKYGVVGDQLWVREAIQASDDHGSPIQYCADLTIDYDSNWCWNKLKLPSIHCPRGMSRIDLEIINLRAERLHSITESDAKAEGAPDYEEGIDSPPPNDGEYQWSYLASFKNLWISINGSESWDDNPWVYVIEFKRIES